MSTSRVSASADPPGVSAVLVTDGWQNAWRAVASLAAQTVANETELVLVRPHDVPLEPPAGFASVQVLDGDPFAMSASLSRAVSAARAPVVFLAETHAFPDPSCLERLLDAFADDRVAGVVPRLVNANPGSAVSAATLIFAYGRWMGADAASPSTVAEHNVAWRTEVLRELPGPLEPWFRAGAGRDELVRSKGLRFDYVPAAVVAHLNETRLSRWPACRFAYARGYAGRRGRRWPSVRRLLYALGSPALIPLLTARALRLPAWREGAGDRTRWAPLALVALTVCSAAGEAVGYLAGGGGAERRVDELEVTRPSYT